MKIKNQFLISIVTFSIILAIIAASVIFTLGQTAQLGSQQAILQKIQTGVSNLNYISNDYFLYRDDSSISQWQAQFEAVSDDLSKLNSTDPEKQALINNIYTDMQHLDSVFVGVVDFLKSESPEANVMVLPGFQTEWSRMTVQIQALAFDVQQFAGDLDNQIYQANSTNIFLILFLLCVFGVYFTSNYIMGYRRTLKSIFKLKEGINIIGSGNLDYSLKRYKQDEMGDIARSVNQMAANLKTVTASKDDLQKEIVERKKAEEELERSTQQLKDAERLATIGTTAGMVGHDIRNPLQAIINDVYIAKSNLSIFAHSEAKEGLEESLDGIEKNVVYIDKIVADLQDYARPLKPVAVETDFENLCEDILLKMGIPQAIKTSQNINENAKQIIADPELVRRIISNLVINAVQAMPQGGRLILRAYRQQGDVIIEVEDTGVGIPENVKHRLFTPLFTTKSKGQGFGLAVVKRVTESMNGTVSFESKEGKGTTFTIRLPSSQE